MYSILHALVLLTDGPAPFECAQQDENPPVRDEARSAEDMASCDGMGRQPADAPAAAQEEPWLERWAPERHMGELGAYGGFFVPGAHHELYQRDLALPDRGHQTLGPGGAVGARIGYFPIRFFGVEAEGGAMPTYAASGDRATMWAVRGSVVGQLGLWSLTPFVLAGAGALGVASSRDAVGDDVDAAVHLGGGLKLFLSRYAMLRLDLRDVIGSKVGIAKGENHNLEATVGVSVTLGRKKSTPAPAPAIVAPPLDTDGDSVTDDKDACVDERGVAPDGCPLKDRDADGFLDGDDQCAYEAGVAPDGCPARDSDGDGFLDPADACPAEPETVNAFEDKDGCADEAPEELRRFNGVIAGVQFDTARATLSPSSRPVLDRAVDVMRQFPDLRVQVVGHTDASGSRETNVALSQARADAVKAYLVEQGIDPERIETRGAGPDEPIADNATKQGRAVNRRIEFKLGG